MTFDEARSLLGVTASDDRTAVRRAYLRAIKEAPPEREPERFMLLREAYDLLRRAVPVEEAGPDAAVQELLTAFREADTEAEGDIRFAALRAKAPDHPEVEHLEYSRAERTERPAIARRARDPWVRLLAMEELPAEFDDEEVVSFARVHGETLGIDLIALLLGRELQEEAFALAKRVAEKSPPAARLMTALQFYREGLRKEGDELFERHRRASRIERPIDHPSTQVLLLLTEQLRDLPRWFPNLGHSLLAHGVILGDRVGFEEVLGVVRGRLRRRRVAGVLMKQGADLVSDGNLESHRQEGFSAVFVWALVIVVGLFALIRSGAESERAIETDSLEAYEASPDRLEEVVGLCELERPPACRRAISIARAAQQGRCDRALGAMRRSHWSYPDTERARDFFDAIEELCPVIH